MPLPHPLPEELVPLVARRFHRLAEPMRRDCRNLTEVVVRSGHWMAQEKPRTVNAALAKWLATQLPQFWPTP